MFIKTYSNTILLNILVYEIESTLTIICFTARIDLRSYTSAYICKSAYFEVFQWHKIQNECLWSCTDSKFIVNAVTTGCLVSYLIVTC